MTTWTLIGSRKTIPDEKGIETLSMLFFVTFVAFSRKTIPDEKGIETRVLFLFPPLKKIQSKDYS